MKNLTGLYWENLQFPSNMYDNITYTFNIGTVTAYYDDNSSSVITEGFTFESDKGSIGNYSSITNSLEFTSPEKVYKEELVNITLSYTENDITLTATVNCTIQPNPMHKSDCIFDTIQKNIHRRWDRFIRTFHPDTRLTSKLNVKDIEDPVSLGDISKYSEIEVDGKKITPETNNYTFNSTGTHTIKYVLKEPATLTTLILNDSAIEEVTIPKSINSISSNAIPNSTKRITVSSGNSTYYSEDNAVVEKSTHKLIFGIDTIPSGVVTIGEETFKEKDITHIVIPSSVTTIEDSAFDSCENLLNITFGSNVSSIGDDILEGCSNIKTITFEGTVPPTLSSNFGTINDDFIIYVPTAAESTYKLEWSTYEDKIYTPSCIIYKASLKLSEITISIANGLHTNAFNSTITSHEFENGIGIIKFDNDIITIGSNAFSGCSNLTSITIPNSVTTISGEAFYGCSGLTSVVIPNSVTTIGTSAFYNCIGLTSIVVESGNSVYDSRNNCNAIIETASNSLIIGCKNTKIPSSVTSIGKEAFRSYSGLTSIVIPSSVTSIGEEAFLDCSGLKSVVVESGNPVYDSRNNCNAIIETSSNTLIAGCKNTKIPSSVTSIGYSAFSMCTGLTSIVIPSSVTSIGNYAFSGCSGLTFIDIPSSVTSIGESAFYDCSGLTSVTIPNSVTSIGDYAFYDCSGLTSVTIGNRVTSIGDYAFGGCSIVNITSLATTEPSIYTNTFRGVKTNGTLYVPIDSSYYSWMGNSNYYLGSYGWTKVEQ